MFKKIAVIVLVATTVFGLIAIVVKVKNIAKKMAENSAELFI